LFTQKGGGTDTKLIHNAILDVEILKRTSGGWEVAYTSMQGLLKEMPE